jgi:hypothetical protein
MATPVNFPSPQPFAPAQSSASTPPGETALVLNINSPLISHPGGAPSAALGSPSGINNGQANDLFQRKTNPPFVPTPGANPAQQLQDAYANALTVRNDAEQARTNFMNLASQLENQALSKSAQPANAMPQPAGANNPFAQSSLPMQPAIPAPAPTFQAPAPPAPQPDPTQQFQQQLQNMQQQQQPQQPAYDPIAQQQMLMQQQAQMQPQPPQAQMDPMQQQMMQQQAQMQQQPPQAQMDPMQQQMLQQQMMQQQAQMQQQPQQPQMDPMQQQQQAFAGGSVADLNTMIAQPRTPDEKLMALNEIAVRQLGDRQTYELLKQEVANPMQGVPPEAATAIRQAALIALGSLNGSPVNAKLPGNQLYGMTAIQQILNNKNENPLVKASAVAALGYMNRPQDKTIQNLLKQAGKDSNPDVKNAVAQVQAGQMIGPAQAGVPQQ